MGAVDEVTAERRPDGADPARAGASAPAAAPRPRLRLRATAATGFVPPPPVPLVREYKQAIAAPLEGPLPARGALLPGRVLTDLHGKRRGLGIVRGPGSRPAAPSAVRTAGAALWLAALVGALAALVAAC